MAGPVGLATGSLVRLLTVTVAWLLAFSAVFAPGLPSRASEASGGDDATPTLVSDDVSTALVAPRFEASGYPPAPPAAEEMSPLVEVDVEASEPDTPPATLPSVESQPRPTLGAALADRVAAPPTTDTLLVPAIALAAYRTGESASPGLRDGCYVPWHVLAGIGKVESGHGTFGGASGSIRPDGTFGQRIVGPALTGGPGIARIRDTDAGRWDDDTRWDRAAGPMQFIPGSWVRFGTDGSGDGVADPHNFYDAAVSAAAHLCGTVPGDYRSEHPQLAQALFGYNHSPVYVSQVLGWIDAYRSLNGRSGDVAPPAEPPAAEHEAERVVALDEPEPAPAPSRNEPTPAVPAAPGAMVTAPRATPTSLVETSIDAGDIALLPDDGARPAELPVPSGIRAPSSSSTPAPDPVGAPGPGSSPVVEVSPPLRPEPSATALPDSAPRPSERWTAWPNPTPTPWPAEPATPSPGRNSVPEATPEPTPAQPAWAPDDVEFVITGSDRDRPQGLRARGLAVFVQRLAAAANDHDRRAVAALVSGVENEDKVARRILEDRSEGGELALARVAMAYPAAVDEPVELHIAVWRRHADSQHPRSDLPEGWMTLDLAMTGKVAVLRLHLPAQVPDDG